MAVGGGSGGHVTPVVAVLKELYKRNPEAEIRFWCDYKFAGHARALIHAYNDQIPLTRIVSGKLRRYHHVSMLRQLFWGKTVLLNIRDLFLVMIGVFQSLYLLIKWRPDVIFIKGGYVCLPVGIAARILKIPFVIHDSDAHPGLTNRILGRWANKIATGAPLDNYTYPVSKATYVGIPISQEFKKSTQSEKLAFLREWQLNDSKPLVVVTGGGLGAGRINDAIIKTLGEITKYASVVLISGSASYDELKSLAPANNPNFQLYPFVSNEMSRLLGCADVVVTRAGATTLHELSAVGVPTIIVPNAMLTGGHQIKNASVYAKENAALIVSDDEIVDDPSKLSSAIITLATDNDLAESLANRLRSFARPHAASEVASMILDTVHNKKIK